MQVGCPGGVVPPALSLLRAAQRNESDGFDHVWWPDHLMGWWPTPLWQRASIAAVNPSPHVYFDPVPAMSAVAVTTDRIRLGTCVTEVHRHPPATLAQSFLTLHHLARGRAILGLGAGEAENLTPYGLPFDRPAARTEEAIRIIRLLWENDGEVDFVGEFWTLRAAVLGLGPYENTFPPIHLAAIGPRMLRVCAELCDGWLPYFMPPDEFAEKAGRLDTLAAAAGRGRRLEKGLWAWTVVHEDERVVARVLEDPVLRSCGLISPDSLFQRFGHEHPFGAGFHGLTEYIPTQVDPAAFEKALAAVPEEVVRASVLAGTPDEVVAELRNYEAAGLDYVIPWNVTYYADVSQLRASYAALNDVRAALQAGAS